VFAQLHEQWIRAFQQRDPKLLEPLLADDFLAYGPEPFTKQQMLNAVRDTSSTLESVSNDALRVRVLGSAHDVAVVTGSVTAKARAEGQAFIMKNRYTEVWVKRGGRWQCVAGQEYRLQAKDGVSQAPPSFSTLEGVSSFAQTFYLNPRPDLIPDLFKALQPTGLSEQPNAVPSFVGFFSEVFTANPGRLAQWQALIPKQEASTRRLLYQALSISKASGVLTIEGHSPAINDMYWGAFFASGRRTYLQKLVDQLRYWDERDDQMLFFAGASAKWSLSSNASSDSLVRTTLAGHTLTADQRTRAHIDELLRKGPAQVKQEMAEVVRQQREAGNWP
jgi:ketosteroid isomerase-like protein